MCTHYPLYINSTLTTHFWSKTGQFSTSLDHCSDASSMSYPSNPPKRTPEQACLLSATCMLSGGVCMHAGGLHVLRSEKATQQLLNPNRSAPCIVKSQPSLGSQQPLRQHGSGGHALYKLCKRCAHVLTYDVTKALCGRRRPCAGEMPAHTATSE